ncbi:hypothetical protein [Idiomarina aquatica]|nr:hypothetical protein [Idiomarina aquatica]
MLDHCFLSHPNSRNERSDVANSRTAGANSRRAATYSHTIDEHIE